MIKGNIVITGFMGSGKTTVAIALARLLGCAALDLDEMIKEREHRSPREIIEQDSEDRFREIETHLLAQLLTDSPVCVVALGGGTWTIAHNRTLLAEHGSLTVWLDAPFDLCWKRIETSGQLRPLAPSYETARKRYQERLDVYGLADHRVPISESESAEEIASKITALISRDGRKN
ncbi:MAG: shikimate kinase [Acidobacteriota bacterium]